MKRSEILEQYEVSEHGTIRSPGKFEGEPLYAVHFYDVILNGFGNIPEGIDEDSNEEHVTVTDEDRAEFPEIGNATHFALWETEQGFVYCVDVSAEYAALAKMGAN